MSDDNNNFYIHKNRVRPVFLLGWLSLAAGLLFSGVPIIRCIYHHYRFNRYIHVEIEATLCPRGSPAEAPTTCKYIFAFEGQKTPEAIQISGVQLHHIFDKDSGVMRVKGTGVVRYHSSSIRISPEHIFVNDHEMPQGSHPTLILVEPDGTMLNARCELRW